MGRLLVSSIVLAASAAQFVSATEVGGLIVSDVTWSLDNSPYIVKWPIFVSGATLTIEPGVVVRVEANAGVSLFSGSIVAQGTKESPILITSAANAPAPGDWLGLTFYDTAVDASFDDDGAFVSGSILEHCIIEYAGGASANAAILLDDAAPCFSHVELRHNQKGGIAGTMTATTALHVSDCEIWGNDGYGIAIVGGAGHVISNNSVYDNVSDARAALSVASASATLLEGNTIDNNASSGGAGGASIIDCSGVTFRYNLVVQNLCTSAKGDAGGFAISVTGSGAGAVITGNTFSFNSNAHFGGGGVRIDGDGVAFTDNIVSNNIAALDGGGILQSSGSGATYSGNLIKNNVALLASSSGGGLSLALSGTALLSQNTFSENFAGLGGGGLRAFGSGQLLVLDNQFLSNGAVTRGGACWLGVSTHLFSNNLVSDNTVTGKIGGGGAIFDSGSSAATYLQNTVTGNFVDAEGKGGAFFILSGTATLADNLVDSNHATKGGAVFLKSADVTFVSNVISNNAAAESGGAIFNRFGSVSLKGDQANLNVITDNVAPLGSAIYNDSSSEVDAQVVCWGTSCTSAVNAMIYDGSDDSELGRVLIVPISTVCDPIIGDLDGDGHVTASDLGALLSAWGACDGCAADLNDDGTVGAPDLTILLGAWSG